MASTGRGVAETFARRVREVRERRGWTQQQLAERLRELGVPIDRTKVNRVETGARAVSVDDALAIAAALGVSPSVLFFPLARSELVRVTPVRVVSAEEGRRWFRGEQPLHPADALSRSSQRCQKTTLEIFDPFRGQWRLSQSSSHKVLL
jgi:transcriptional regulator with XRE-family HTH domain